MAKKAKYNDAIMADILVTKFKMGQIGVKDLERMAVDTTRGRGARLQRRFWKR